MGDVRYRSVDITIRARDEATAAFKSAESGMSGFRNSAAEMAAHLFLGARGLRYVLDAASVGVAAYRGEWEKAIEIWERLPLARELEEIIQLTTGWTDRTKEQAEAMRDAARALAEFDAKEKVRADYAFRGGVMTMSPFDKRLAEIDREEGQAVAPFKGATDRDSLEAMRAVNQWAELARLKAQWEQMAADDKSAALAAADVKRAQDEIARGQAEAAAAIRDAQSRSFMATHDARERELRAIDDWYAEQQIRWKDHADVMAAMQDSYVEQRAAVVARQNREFAEEFSEWAFNQGLPEAVDRGPLPRAVAPLLESRFLTSAPVRDPVAESNRLLGRIADTLDRQERREDRPPAEAGPTVRIVQ